MPNLVAFLNSKREEGNSVGRNEINMGWSGPTQLSIALGDIVGAARARRGLSQRNLAEKVGSQRSYISRLESGRVHPNLETLERVAEGLDVPLSTLIFNAERRLPKRRVSTQIITQENPLTT